MAEDSSGPWWITIAAGMGPVASGIWVVYQYFKNREDKQHTEELTREQMLMRDLDSQRAAASKEAADLFERARLELARRDAETERKDAKINALEKDVERWKKEVERWIAVARGWQTRCFSLKHALNNARQEINALLFKAGQIEKTWPDSDNLPSSLEDPDQ